MKLRNTGLTPITLPSGRIIPPGVVFPSTAVDGPQLQAWLTADNVRYVPDEPKRPSKKEISE